MYTKLTAISLLIPLFFLQIFLVQDDSVSEPDEILALYLTFVNNPLTEITINWHTTNSTLDAEVEYRIQGENDWQLDDTGKTIPFPDTDRFIHRNTLNGLTPGSVYEFRFVGHEETNTFRTLPTDLTEPLVFIASGDIYSYDGNRSAMDAVGKAAGAVSPYFVAVGGDWAYADSDPTQVGKWFVLFDSWLENVVTPEGHLVPMVPGIGNHENSSSMNVHKNNVRYFYHLFEMPYDDGAYFNMTAGDYLSIIMLDSQHSKAVAGHQTTWLEQQLAANQDKSHIFPVYHIPAYPSNRNINGNTCHYHSRIRDHWVPLFEQYSVKIAFENHDHTYKRTFPLKNYQIDSTGIVYIGDGAWGVPTRPMHANNSWYIEEFSSTNHFLKVEITPDDATVTAISRNNAVIDQYSTSGFVTSSELPRELPQKAQLEQNYPNPFNPTTNIRYEIPSVGAHVNLSVYNMIGQQVATLINETKNSGQYEATFSTTDLSSGTYIYRLKVDGQILTQTMMLIK